jgi:hypothetical protein
MTDQEKWVEALARLTRKTLEGEVRWESIPPTQVEPEAIRIKAYETTFRGQRIRAYRTRPISTNGLAHDVATWILGRRLDQFIIEFLDSSGNPAYRPPILDGTKDLFSAIEDQAAPAGQFLEVLLHD